ncbi:transcription factor tau 138 kDa subunit [Monosporozyma servazzii]
MIESDCLGETLPMFPDEIVGKIYEEITYNKGSIQINKIWDIFNISHETMQKFVLQCCLANEDVMLIQTGKPVPNKNEFDLQLLLNDTEGEYSLQLQEDRLWIILTGYNKKESKVGNYAFDLLLEIAHAKEKGINTMELAKATKQDPRSITGRLKTIEYLFQSVQLIYKGHVVKKLTLTKFASQNDNNNTNTPTSDGSHYVSMRQHLETIVNIVKNSKNGVRQINDLRREMKFDKQKRASKSFLAAVNWLAVRGYLRIVLVIPPNNPDVKVRCVQYQRDYVNKNDGDFDDESSSDDNEEDTAGPEDDEEEVYEGIEKANGNSVLTDQGVITEEKNNAKSVIEKNEMLMNRFYPVQNQTYALSEKTGERGLSTIDAMKLICGKDFQRSYAKSSEYFLSIAGKKNNYTSGLKLFKIYDFEGKKKFYRTFTEENFNKCFDNEVRDDIGVFKALPKQTTSLATLDKKNYSAMNPTVRFGIDKDGNEVFFWHGEDPEELDFVKEKKVSRKTGGRDNFKRKQDDVFSEEQHTIKKIKTNETNGAVNSTDLDEKEYVTLSEPISTKNSATKSIISVNGFHANSLASLKRQKNVLTLLKKYGGFAFIRENFFDELSKMLGSTTTIDKKTLDNDISFLCKNNKVVLKSDKVLKKKYIYLPELDEDTVENFLTEDKDTKKEDLLDVIPHNDLYFFDAEEEKKFNNESKALQRLRKFKENAAAKSATASTKPKRKRKPREPKTKTVKDSSSNKKLIKIKTIKPDSNFNISGKDSIPKLSFLLKKETLPVLIKAVVITKSITKEIQWSAVSRLFPKNSLGNLKKKWATRRIRMGNSGLKLLVQKWRSILVDGIKKETVTMEDVEQLHLSILLKLWLDHEDDGDVNSVKLYQAYEDNKNKYILAADPQQNSARMSNVLSSMIQRETFLLKETYTVTNSFSNTNKYEKSDAENKIRSVVRSILIDKPSADANEIQALKDIPQELVEKTLVEMAREKQIYLKGSRLELNATVGEFFENNENVDLFKKAAAYSVKLEGLLQSGNGVIISDEPQDISTIGLIDVIERKLVDVYEVPMEKQDYRFYYTSRKFEIDTLTPPLILTVKDKTKRFYANPKSEHIPLDTPYSRLWVNAQGGLRESVWKKCICFIVYTIIFRPGITIERLLDYCNQILSFSELSTICHWLSTKGYLQELPFGGYSVSTEWPRLLL